MLAHTLVTEPFPCGQLHDRPVLEELLSYEYIWFISENSEKNTSPKIVLLWLKNTHVEQGGAIIRTPPRFVLWTLGSG